MSFPVKALAATAVLLIAVSAKAQLFPTWETHITLTQQDLDMIRGAVNQSGSRQARGNHRLLEQPRFGQLGIDQAGQKTHTSEPAMRGNRIYSALEGSVDLQRALPFHQLSTTGRDLENRLSFVEAFAYGPGTDRRNHRYPR
jgi:hypothetical protein